MALRPEITRVRGKKVRSVRRRLQFEAFEERLLLTTTLASINALGTAAGNAPSANISDAPLSSDGRYVVFQSTATDLTSTSIATGTRNVFVHDQQTGATTLVSVNAAGTASGNGNSGDPEITPDGRFVVFQSSATDLTAIPNASAHSEIYVRDLTTGTTTLVSVNAAGTAAGNDDSSGLASITPDGRFVLFTSNATNLTNTPDTNNVADAFVRDLTTGTTTLVSVNAAGTAAGNQTAFGSGVDNPIISPDGRFVAFGSDATDLTASPNNSGDEEVYERDLTLATTTLVSVNAAGNAPDDDDNFFLPAISSNGQFVVFETRADDVTAIPNPNTNIEVYVRDLSTNTTSLVSVNPAGNAVGDGDSIDTTDITPDGRFVTFGSFSDNLTATPDTGGNNQVFVRDLSTGTTTLVSVNAAGTAAGNSEAESAVISSDGQLVAFRSESTDLTALPDANNAEDVFVRDLSTGKTTLVSTNAAGTAAGNADSVYPFITPDGQSIAYQSDATDLTATPDNNSGSDVFVFQRGGGGGASNSTTTTVTSSALPSVFGQSVTFTATVAATGVGIGRPAGTVTFMDGSTTLGSGTLTAAGVATFTTATLAAGTHPISAVYSGDSGDLASSGALGNGQRVNPAPLTIKANDASKTAGQTASFAAAAFTASGLVGGDTISGVTETSAGAGPAAVVGSYPIVPSAAIFAAGLGSNYAITYANGTLAVNSGMLNPVVASQLVVTAPPPGSVATGTPFTLTVTAEDSAGNVATSFVGNVSVVLASDPGGAALAGTLSATATGGVATFKNLALNTVGGGFVLQVSGGGLSVNTGAIAATAGGSAASHQFLSTAEKQVFLDLAATYALRATRLTAIATTAPAPLAGTINELAAYFWDESLTFAAIANDPPDASFTTVAPAQNATLPPLTAGAGITQAEADTFNALFAEQAQALGLAQAISTALNSAQAAAADPSNATYEQMQLAAVAQFSQQLGTLAASEPGLEANVQTALQSSGVADVSVSAAGIQALQAMVSSSGLPAGLVSALQQLAAGDSQLQGIQLQQIQAQLLAQNAAAGAGSLFATLTDPAFASQIQNAAQALTATVLLSGGLTPASASGVSRADGVHTNVATPTVTGTAPAGTTVQLFAQSQASGTPVLIGSGVTDSTGHWQITANHLGDGSYALSARFSGGDSGAGQVTPLTQAVIQTVAPHVVAVTYSHKTGKVVVIFDDPAGINATTLANSANFVARNGKTAKGAALKISAFQSAGTQVSFTVAKGRSHPAGIYLEVLAGGVRDLAGNGLDGAFSGTFPSGSGHPGSNFSTPVPIPRHKAVKPKKAPHKGKG